VAEERVPAPRRIVSVLTDDDPHGHVIEVGVDGDPGAPFDRMTVDDVRAELGEGVSFYALTTDRPVRASSCRVHGCHVPIIEAPDDTANDILTAPNFPRLPPIRQ